MRSFGRTAPTYPLVQQQVARASLALVSGRQPVFFLFGLFLSPRVSSTRRKMTSGQHLLLLLQHQKHL